jgi:diguanylate cyclase (GGDEF)-like protein
MRQIIADSNFSYQQHYLQATISLGVSTYCCDSNINDQHQLISIADHYLYQAKHAGSNKVCYDKNSVLKGG